MYLLLLFVTAQKTFSAGYCFALRLFFFFFFLMFASALSLERLDRSQPNFHTRGGLAQTLLKMGVVGLTVWKPSWKKTVFPLHKWLKLKRLFQATCTSPEVLTKHGDLLWKQRKCHNITDS